MEFEWDEAKARRNKAKHGLEFKLVYRFEFGTALIEYDNDVDYGEERWRAIGFIGTGMYTIIFTERLENVYRIISLRKASPPEEDRYATSI